MTDHDLNLREHAYAVTMAVSTMVTAMGMQAENQMRLQRSESIAYSEKAFDDLINKNGCCHNGVLSLQWVY